MHISLAWWNTSLSPFGKSRATPEERSFALGVVKYLTKQINVDCLALGEVTAGDISYFIQQGQLIDYKPHDGTLKVGKLQFDTGLLYRRKNLQVVDWASLVVKRGRRSLKLANRIDFLVPDCEKPLHVFVSHWPSRRWCESNGAVRHLLGVRLRDKVVELNRLYKGKANTILLGDYNDEPFSLSLSEQLMATRDRRLVRKYSELLYNPFWRHLGEPDPHVPGFHRESYGGSYFHSSGNETHWRTFDQIIFSSAFLGRSDWQLNEQHTQILQLWPLVSLISRTKTIFDHFPVLSVIEREGIND